MDRLLRIILLPLLLVQAVNVRRKALRLPEPAGPRFGQLGQGEPLRLLIAGDSSAAGVGVSRQEDALSGQLVNLLAPGRHLTWRLEASNGHRTADTRARLLALPPQQFDVAVLALGVNDVTRLSSARRFHMEQSALIALLQDRFGVELVVMSGVPPMAQFPALPSPLAWILGRHAARLDRVLARLATQSGVVHLPFEIPADPDLAAQDGYHPSAQAYALWAAALANSVRQGHLQHSSATHLPHQ
ncbi:SGNH/GDSL hydrolase family protein [Phaeobacter porticola]|uniref:Lysophospholipase L1 n=1 Tax=Phaeobacter porticola TaxID=1844006 RepID=A0A1L3I8Y4_9RHOB|nr:SGNH/GDSL hydrolase family protein [Phaeobacter porticola]APG48577.1 Lysophospholipase L1 [Phaeobacter porticola]